MSDHQLSGRSESEVLWTKRRSFLQAAAAWSAMGGFAAAHAQQRSNVVELVGEALLNGQPLQREQSVVSGDRIQTGPGSNLIFVIGNSSFQVRQNSQLVVERGSVINAVSVLRLITGAVGSFWGKGTQRLIVTPTLTAGIRGTSVYTEIFADQGGRSYLCNCHGVIDVAAGQDRVVSESSYHQAFWGEVAPRNGRLLNPAGAINHTDEEMETLAALVGQRTAWQIMGRKGVKDGKGYMDANPTAGHPADALRR